ncbi:hypothetical protein [Polyangium sorediatum]|uniref:Uncharacterized protein n=1 Tax=Polyangium sorediatum TaxID=889274 RepID=A0ABT6P4Z3_9BACT|nr:hypothetical protein [Polyangium sorediatum]MDI1435377.1 hypothetical protein [Polyangium sorediatum]
MSDIIVTSCRYHLGDNPSVFQDGVYIGYNLTLPLAVTWLDDQATVVALHFETRELETWGAWKGHPVHLNGHEIGRLKDAGNQNGRIETIRIAVPMAQFRRWSEQSGGNLQLSILLEKQPSHPSLSDDFMLTRISAIGAVMRLGTK